MALFSCHYVDFLEEDGRTPKTRKNPSRESDSKVVSRWSVVSCPLRFV